MGVPDSLNQLLQTQHPGIGGELENAIKTLRKLQKIAGPPIAEHLADSDDIGSTHVSQSPDDINATYVPQANDDANAANLQLSTDDGTLNRTFVGEPAKQATDTDDPGLARGESFGRYQIVRLLGKGAMGAVYLAYDGQLDRHVAIKIPSLDNAETIERFYREARAAAKLRSPNICPVYDVDQINGIHYITMSFIDGQPLSQVIRDGELKKAKDIARIVQRVALGLQKAHDQGTIHRDLKPDNVMIDSDGEPIVMDFGLARRLDDNDIHVTRSGVLLGTPAYMSPEQVLGDQSAIGLPTDIFSLGVILYEILTGQLPFQGSLLSVIQKIGHDEPPRPSQVASAIRDDPQLGRLEQICLKMMAKSTSDRFASMSDVAEALDEFLGAKPVADTSGGWKKILRRFLWPFASASI